MLDVPLLKPTETERAAKIFHRDGFVVIKDALTGDQMATARAGADRVIKQQMDETPLDAANRGHARYSFGQQIQHPEWQMLVALDTVLPTLEAIWGSDDFYSMGGGGDYSAPGAKIQHLHSDMGEFLHDPFGQSSMWDLPAPFIVVNFPLVDFTVENGATRFVPCTQRTKGPVPSPDEEPEWMKTNVLCAPAGCALVRDVRCWHGGTENRSSIIRPMVSTGYFAPWFRRETEKALISQTHWDTLTPRAQKLLRYIGPHM